MSHKIAYTDDSAPTILTPKVGTPTKRVVIIGGVHGDELAGRLAPSEFARLLMFYRKDPLPEAIDQIEFLIIPEASPRACAIGQRCDNGISGDLNVSWSGLTLNEREERELTSYSVKRAAEIEGMILKFNPDVVISFHAMNVDAIMAWTVDPIQAPFPTTQFKSTTCGGLPQWCKNHGILGIDLEAPSLHPSLRDSAAELAMAACDFLAQS